MNPKIIIVDENDTIIGYRVRETLESEAIYRVSALWVTNSKGDILLAQRAFNKKHSPGKWGPAVAGTIEEGEEYLMNIKKEAEEEIGLKYIAPVIGPKERMHTEYNYFCQWYTLVVDKELGEFVIERSEVAKVRWFSQTELKRELELHPDNFLQSLPHCLELFCKEIV